MNVWTAQRVIALLLLLLVSDLLAQKNNSGTTFRILAPQFVCPKENEEEITSHNLDQSVIRFQMAPETTDHLDWIVRWRSHGQMSQRSTLLLWKTIRALERDLNKEPLEPFTYIIDNDKLLPGIDYLFNITAVSTEGVHGQQGNFKIAYDGGRRRLDLHDETVIDNKFSVLLLGSEMTYAHLDYELVAQVTMCQPTDDYHFMWRVTSISDQPEQVDVSDQIGGNLLIPAGTLRGGRQYYVTCELRRSTDYTFLTKVGLFVKVFRRGLEVNLSYDELVISQNQPFHITGDLYNYDNLPTPMVFEWSCNFKDEPCTLFQSVDDHKIYLSSGFSEIGEYEIKFQASADGEMADAKIRVRVLEAYLPVIQVEPTRRLLNEGTTVELVANASNISPSCSLAWYFASDDHLVNNSTNDTCEDCEHGELLGQTVTIFSMEETFLNELADFSNETEGREVIAELLAMSGRARLLAKCGCSETFSCDTKGTAYVDVYFKLNASPRPESIKITPDSGTALDTLFRLSTLALADHDQPLRYTFYYSFGNTSRVVLGSYTNYVADETVLPYMEGGVPVAVEVCDAWGACGRSPEQLVTTTPDTRDGTAARLAGASAAHLRRCELEQFTRVAVTGLLTLKNTDQADDLQSFSASLVETLKASASKSCIQNQIQHYYKIIDLLGEAGMFEKMTSRLR